MTHAPTLPVCPPLEATSLPAAPPEAPVTLHPPAPLHTRVVNLGAVLIPFAGVIVAGVMAWGVALDWVSLSIMLVMYIATGLGITIGYHRLFTHKAFSTSRFMTFVWGMLGTMAAEGPVLEWVATHRCHHQHSDSDHDPHSPHTHGDDIKGLLLGIWHSHVGWLFNSAPADFNKYARDLQRDPIVRHLSRRFGMWFLVGLLVPAVAGGLLTMSWAGAGMGFLWGGLVRVFLVHHVTWSVNSVCHLWGSRPFECHDESRNNPIVGVLAMGEGWHNNHHAFPASARHGLAWWQFDLSYVIIWAMERVGLAWDVRRPSPEIIARRSRTNPTPNPAQTPTQA
ncbi:MAG: fatty acid desaturase [Phycisphaerales bacterium]|nr:fatty acid desaturase [Phycisphaerales bacterium]